MKRATKITAFIWLFIIIIDGLHYSEMNVLSEALTTTEMQTLWGEHASIEFAEFLSDPRLVI